MAGILYVIHHRGDTAATVELIRRGFPEAVTKEDTKPGALARADLVVLLVGPRFVELLNSATVAASMVASEIAAALNEEKTRRSRLVHVLLAEGGRFFARAELPQNLHDLMHKPVSTLQPGDEAKGLAELRRELDRRAELRLSPPTGSPGETTLTGSSRKSDVAAATPSPRGRQTAALEPLVQRSATRIAGPDAEPAVVLRSKAVDVDVHGHAGSTSATRRDANAALPPDEMSSSVAESRRGQRARRDVPGDPPPAPTRSPGFFSRFFGRAQEQQVDTVDCSVFSVARAAPGSTVLVQVFLHVPEHAERVQGLAALMDSSTALKGTQTLDIDLPRGAPVTITLSAPGLDVDEPQQTVRWRGKPVFCQFQVTLPPGSPAKTHRPVVRVAVSGGLVGRIVFELLAYPLAPSADRKLTGEARRYERAFLSYASPDRREVLKRAQVLQAARVGIFQDILSLDPGARWEKEIYKHIDECDVFLLFWSNAARQSEWVVKEAEYALARQETSGLPDIVPVIIETPPPLPPAGPLSALHFNDRVHYLIATS